MELELEFLRRRRSIRRYAERQISDEQLHAYLSTRTAAL